MKMRSMIAIAVVAVLTACAQVGLPTPQTCNERVAVGIGTVTQLRTTATELLKANKITVADAANVQAQADHARAGAEIARRLCQSDPSGADAKLTAVTTVLQGLSVYLTAKGQ